MNNTINLTVNSKGEINRDEDGKLVAIIGEGGEITYKAAAYKKGNYKDAIEAIAKDFDPSQITDSAKEELVEEEEIEVKAPAVISNAPPKCKSLGAYSAEWINYDHANLSDKEFEAKYKTSAEAQLNFIARSPQLFLDRPALDERFDKLRK